MAYNTDLAQLFAAIQADIATTRASYNLPPLNGPDGAASGSISVGQEFRPYQLAPPSIVMQPDGLETQPAQRPGERDPSTPTVRVFSSPWLLFTAYLWGDSQSDVQPLPPYVGDALSPTIELYRELEGALYRQCGGRPAYKIISAQFDQQTDAKRDGRMLVVSFGIRIPITDEPYVSLPFATATTSGVEIDATIVATSPDGTSTLQVGSIIAPPP